MRKIIYYLVIAFLPLVSIAQVVEKQTTEGDIMVTDSIRSIIPVSKQSLLRDMDVIFNTRFAYDSNFNGNAHDYSSFNVNQFRLELKGKIHDKVYFRFRSRYTKVPEPGSIDNVSQAVDLAFLRIDLSERTNFSFGKLCADWGGYEFDFNPIDILEYNDIINNADNFLAGAGISHTLKSKKHSFSAQVLNSRTNTFQDQYGSTVPANLKASDYPLAFVGNWRGSFFKGKLETTWSYSLFNEAVGSQMNYVALGNKFQPSKKFVVYYDFQYSLEGLDRKGIVSSIINTNNSNNGKAATNALYVENWIRAEWLVSPKWNLLLTVMNSTNTWKDNPAGSSTLSTSYGAIPTIQYLPFKDFNMKFYLGYVYRRYDYTSYAETAFGVKDYTTGRLSFGIIAPLLVL